MNVFSGFLVMVASVVGSLTARYLLSFRQSHVLQVLQEQRIRAQIIAAQQGEQVALTAVNHLTHSNTALIGFLLTSHEKLMKELVFDATDKDSDIVSHEIEISEMYRSDIDRLVTPDLQNIVQTFAAWGHSVLSSFHLTLDRVSIETDASSDMGRRLDVVVVFHVRGTGDDSLRFQAEASRKLRRIVEGCEVEEASMLRCDVRWK